MIYLYIIIGIFIIFSLFIGLILHINLKINKLEKNLLNNFKEKNNIIPSIYDITDSYLIKHDEIFKEIIHLRKKDFIENSFIDDISEKTLSYKLIHNELNFIFKVCNKHQKLAKNAKFLYIRDVIIAKSSEIGEKLINYKRLVKIYNKLIKIKNITIIGLIFPISKKNTI